MCHIKNACIKDENGEVLNLQFSVWPGYILTCRGFGYLSHAILTWGKPEQAPNVLESGSDIYLFLFVSDLEQLNAHALKAVSYTHLTLPTIYSV